MQADKPDRAGMTIPPPLLFAGTFIVGAALNRITPLPFLPPRFKRPIGFACLVLQAFFGPYAAYTMRQADTAINPGSPSTHLVVGGPFRWSRNPIYVSMLLIYIGFTALVNTRWTILLLPFVLAMIRRQVVYREEPYLERTFGEEYRQYRTQVRRWI